MVTNAMAASNDGQFPMELAQPLPQQGVAMQAISRVLDVVADTHLPLLILGEPGVGKRELARRVHQLSGGRPEQFSELDCAKLSAAELVYLAAPEYQILEDDPTSSEIKTLVLREIADLDPSCQSALQDLIISPHGTDCSSRRPRLIFLSDHNLDQDVRFGRFREDLYCRVSSLCLRIPPLRHRREEIPALMETLLAKYAILLSREKQLLSEGAMQALTEYGWPGNLRELEDAARTIAAIGNERVALAALKSKQRANRSKSGRVQRLSLKDVSRAASRAAE